MIFISHVDIYFTYRRFQKRGYWLLTRFMLSGRRDMREMNYSLVAFNTAITGRGLSPPRHNAFVITMQPSFPVNNTTAERGDIASVTYMATSSH